MSYDALRDYVFDLDIVDTHEHLPSFEKWRNQEADVLSEYLTHYFSCDLVSAGLSDEALAFARDVKSPLAKRWKTVAPFWDAARNTGYGRSLDLAARLIYGIERIDGRTLGSLDEAFRAAREKGGHFDRVLKQISRIEVSIEDGLSAAVKGPKDSVDPRYFRPVTRCDAFISPANAVALGALSKQTGVAIHTLDDLKRACEVHLETNLKAGAIGIKCGLAYQRPLRFEKVSAGEAERGLSRCLGLSPSFEKQHDGTVPDSGTVPAEWPMRKLQDHMMHFVCSLADARGLPFQIHTGLQEGNGNYIDHSDPALLSNLFMEYKRVKFDLFHIGYPYQQTLSALAKNFRNVFIDFAWANVISPEAAIRALIEYLDAVPANKISGFGGDYAFIDGVAGHAYLARENVAKALAFKVKHGSFDLARAKELARMILHDNPAAIFGLKKGR